MKIPFDRALLITLGGTLLAALVVGGVTLDRRLAAELEEDARKDLAMAPPLLVDRQSTQAEALRMHAMEIAGSEAVASAIAAGDRARAMSDAETIAEAWPETPVVVGLDGEVWVGPVSAGRVTAAETMAEGPYVVVYDDGKLHAIALAPVMGPAAAVGVAGAALPLDLSMAEIVAGLTRAGVVLLGQDGAVVASTLDSIATRAVAAYAPQLPSAAPLGSNGVIAELDIEGVGRHWATVAGLGTVGTAVFVQSADRELAALPRLRQAGLLAAGLALAVTLLMGLMIAQRLSRPVRALADASLGLAAGDFETPLPTSRIEEMDTVSGAFEKMRTTLKTRLEELAAANHELEDRQARLQALQSELIQRDRLVAAGRLVTELAHEIRNPVANVRNSLEVVRRHVDNPKALEFTDLAISELLRMHELAERMLDLNRPTAKGDTSCDVRAVVENVAALAGLGDRDSRSPVSIEGRPSSRAMIPADSLKQVLLNLVTNAQEASPDGGAIEIRLESVIPEGAPPGVVRIEIADHGSGIPEGVLPRIFDPFFTTKAEVHGVGLGLFIAEGVVRSHGGSLGAANREPRPGAVVKLELPAAEAEAEGSEAS